MLGYSLNPSKEKSVKVLGRGLRISRKNSTIICKEISGMALPKARALVERLVNKEQDLGGKYYTNASTQILEILKSGENNAEFKGLEAARMIVNASAHQGFRFFRPRRFKNRRQRRKVTNIQLVLMER